ncbi:MAG: hypothetical protein MUO58_19515, partial [Anaerolineales bacterium]|nr:hypothetical protein [Anaerolineales bacterium]
MENKETREGAKTSPDLLIAELDLSARAESALAKAGVLDAGKAIEMMEKGDLALLDIDGFGRKSLADLKRALKRRGFELPDAALEPQV